MILEEGDDDGAGDGGDEVDYEPGGAAFDGVRDGVVDGFICAGAEEFLEVFGGFGLEDIDDVVVFDDTEDAALIVDDGEVVEVELGHG